MNLKFTSNKSPVKLLAAYLMIAIVILGFMFSVVWGFMYFDLFILDTFFPNSPFIAFMVMIAAELSVLHKLGVFIRTEKFLMDKYKTWAGCEN